MRQLTRMNSLHFSQAIHYLVQFYALRSYNTFSRFHQSLSLSPSYQLHPLTSYACLAGFANRTYLLNLIRLVSWTCLANSSPFLSVSPAAPISGRGSSSTGHQNVNKGWSLYISYDVNQLFWYREGIARIVRIVLNDKVRMQLNLKCIKSSNISRLWDVSFQDLIRKRSMGHLFVN